MSLILEALKRSEAERQRVQPQTLAATPPRPMRRSTPLWVAGAMLAVGAASAGWWWQGRDADPASNESVAVAPSAQAAGSVAPPSAAAADAAEPAQAEVPAPATTAANDDARPPAPVPETIASAEPVTRYDPILGAVVVRPGEAARPAGTAAVEAPTQAPTQALTQSPTESPQTADEAVQASSRKGPDVSAAEPGGPAVDSVSETAAAPTVIESSPPPAPARIVTPDRPAPADPLARTDVETGPGTASAAIEVATRPPTPAPATALPKLSELPPSARAAIGELDVNIHVYDESADARFVLINLKRYREGDQLTDELSVLRIRPGGIELSWRGQRFLLPARNG